MSISVSIKESIEQSSWIRKMFEEGARLKAEFGEENVFDFSLGNPDVEPPVEFFKTLQKSAGQKIQGIHGYMPNAGFPDVREAVAKKVSGQHNLKIDGNSIIMACGAAGAMNVVLKTILDPDDEVIVICPYFAEYGFYISNHRGKMVQVKAGDDLSLDTEKVKKAITARTRAVIINSPNNPTGKIYSEKEIEQLAAVLEESANTRPVFIIADEPYREIVYDKKLVSPVLSKYRNSFVVNSYSKSLSLPGERIGYIAVSPDMDGHDIIMAGLNLCNRILGFVNAPALMQRVVAELNDVSCDVESYRKRRDMLMHGLKDAGYEFIYPEGAFYLFCKAPGGDDIAFVKHLQSYNILAVPGVGFGGPGFFRLAYCVSENTIINSISKFKEAIESYNKL